MKKLITLITITLIANNCFAQDQHLIDSFEAQLKCLKATKLELSKLSPKPNDTKAENILYELSMIYTSNNLDKAIELSNQSLTLSEKIGYNMGIANEYKYIGETNSDKEDYLTALDFKKKQ